MFSLLTSFIEQTAQELPEFELEFIHGCNAVTHHYIKVSKLNQVYIAKHISPTYYNGTTIDSVLTVVLNEDQIEDCKKFIAKAKSLPRKCMQITSSEFHHILYLINDTVDVDGNCAWNNLDYDFLDNSIFKQKHKEIENKKTKFLTTLNNNLKGKWYLQPIKGKLKKDTKIVFSKTKVTKDFIDFDTNNKLKGSCNSLLQTTKLTEYETEISDSWNATVITLKWGKEIYINKDQVMYDHTATFTFDKLEGKNLILNYLWRD